MQFEWNDEIYEENKGTGHCTECDLEDDHIACREAYKINKCQGSNWKIILIVKQPIQSEEPGVKFDSDKVKYSLLPPYALQEAARNLTEGLKKYTVRGNWKLVKNARERYLDALYRHLEAYRRGEKIDSESSAKDMQHLAAVVVNAMFLLEFDLDPNLVEVKE